VSAEDKPYPGLEQIEGVRCTFADGVAEVALTRPELGNSLTRPMVGRLTEFFEAVSGDRNVRVVVLAPEGDAFCTGPDLRVGLAPSAEPLDPPRVLGDIARGTRAFWQRLIESILDCEKPVLAALNGTAAGAGVQLALACDLVIAGERGRMIEIFVRRGIAPDAGAAYLLTRLVGLQQAKRICFFGKPVDAAEALRLGLVTEVVESGQLAERVRELAAELATGPTMAIAAAKRLINHAPDIDRHSAMWEEAQIQEAIVSCTRDAQEGLTSFLERRPTRFVGF
jgi:2-(1,2-epoxy-1,2-dihydrophenyl)acetyl-CoA isomerase